MILRTCFPILVTLMLSGNTAANADMPDEVDLLVQSKRERELGRIDDAIRTLRAYVNANPTDPFRLIDLGQLLIDGELLAEAEVAFTRVLRDFPETQGLPDIANAFLKVIQLQRDSRRPNTSVVLSLDTGVESSKAPGQIVVPGIGVIISEQRSIRRDRFAESQIAVSSSWRPSAEWFALARASASGFWYQDSKNLDSKSANSAIRLSYKIGKQDTLSATATATTLQIDDTFRRSGLGIRGEWEHHFSDATEITYAGHFERFSQKGFAPNLANAFGLGVAVQHSFLDWKWKPVVRFTTDRTHEESLDTSGGATKFSNSATIEAKPIDQTTVSVGVSTFRSVSIYINDGGSGNSSYRSLTLSIGREVSKSLTIKASAKFTDSDVAGLQGDRRQSFRIGAEWRF